MLRTDPKIEPSLSCLLMNLSEPAQNRRNHCSTDFYPRSSVAEAKIQVILRFSSPFLTKTPCRLSSKLGGTAINYTRYLISTSYCYFHINFNGFSFFKSQIQLCSRFRFFFFNCFCIFHIFEVILKCYIEVK